jgi:hypothetical protein
VLFCFQEVDAMSVNKEELHEMIEQLRDIDRATVYDFLQFLIERNGRGFSWEETERLEIDHEPLSEEILYRIKNAREEDYLTGEDARREFPGIQVNLP